MRKVKLLIATLSALGWMGLVPAAGAVDLKIATVLPENTQWMRDMREGGKELAERTDGRVNFRFYSGGVQGSADKVLRKIKIGQLHGGAFTPTDLQQVYPDLNIYGLPFLFESADEVDYVRERVDPKLTSGLEDAGFVSFGFAGGGFALVMSNVPVSSHDDLRGRKVWVPEGDLISYETMQAL
jgi:TRAP-type transport system periplasmic protein